MKSFLAPIALAVVTLTACVPATQQVSTTIPVSATSQPPTSETASNPSQTILPYENVLDATDWPKTELDSEYPPLDLYGSEYVSTGPDGEIYLINVSAGSRSQITSDGLSKSEAVLSDRYIAWLAWISGDAGAADLFVFDRETGQQQKITAEPATRMQLALDGTRLVWADKRNEENAYYADYDLYTYDLATGVEVEIAVAPGAQYSPSISGNRVVWQDNRNSPHLDKPLAGCGNCPENHFDIYLFDFETGASQAIVENEWLKAEPFIEGDKVVWTEYRRETGTVGIGGSADLFLLNLSSNQIQQLTSTTDSETSPRLSENRLLWIIRSDCDVIEIGPDGKEVLPATGIYLLNLEDGQIYRLSDEKESRALFDKNIVIVQSGCMTDFRFTAITFASEPGEVEPPPPAPSPTAELSAPPEVTLMAARPQDTSTPAATTLVPAPGETVEGYEIVLRIHNEDKLTGRAGQLTRWLAWGSTVFTIAPDGSYWLVDITNGDYRLVQLSPDGEILDTFPIQAPIMTDIVASEEYVWVLGHDYDAIVIQIRLADRSETRFMPPSDYQSLNGLSGIALSETGELLLERFGGIFVTRLIFPEKQAYLQDLPGYEVAGNLYRVMTTETCLACYIKGFPYSDFCCACSVQGPVLVNEQPLKSLTLSNTTTWCFWEQHLMAAFTSPGWGRIQWTPVPPLRPAWATSPDGATNQEIAQNTLITFLALLDERKYAEAGELYGGGMEGFEPRCEDYPEFCTQLVSIQAEPAQFWQTACSNLLACFSIGQIAEVAVLSDTEFRF